MDPSGFEGQGAGRSQQRAPSDGPDESGFGPATLAERVDDALVRLDRLRGRPAVAVVAIGAVIVLAALAWWWVPSRDAGPVEDLIPQVSLATTESVTSDGPEADVIVHVSGEVNRPGVVSLPATARVLDAVEAAGGPTGDAELHRLNLAAPLVDGIQIRVPAVGEAMTDLPPLLGVDGATIDGPIDINTASASELERLDGVGPAIAEAIVAHRSEHGPFGRVEELLDVAGIGPAKLDAIGDDAIVR